MELEASRELIARAREDRAAFGELYDLYLLRVYGFCRAFSRTREEAEDRTAETFERAMAGITRYEERDVPLSRWLMRIARNAIIDHARRSSKSVAASEVDSFMAVETYLADWEEAHWLRMHVQSLPKDQREVVRLRFYEDQRFGDVAAHMGRSEGAVKQLLRRALHSLHHQIQAEAEEVVGLE